MFNPRRLSVMVLAFVVLAVLGVTQLDQASPADCSEAQCDEILDLLRHVDEHTDTALEEIRDMGIELLLHENEEDIVLASLESQNQQQTADIAELKKSVAQLEEKLDKIMEALGIEVEE